MNTKIIKLDINRRLYDKIVAKQDDTGSRFLLFQLLDGAVPFNLTDRSVRVYGVKPDGAVIFNDLTVTHSATGFCLLELTNQMLAIVGTVKLELMITEGDKKLTSIPFEMEVIKKINSNDAVESSNEFRALLNALKEINDWNKEFADKSGKLEELYTPRLNELGSQLETIESNKADKEQTSSLQGQINSLVVNGTGNSNPEIIQARVNVTGVEFGTLTERNLFIENTLNGSSFPITWSSWEEGGINTNTGIDVVVSGYLRTKGYLNFNGLLKVNCSVTNATVYVLEYSKLDKSFIKTTIKSQNFELTNFNNYYRFVVTPTQNTGLVATNYFNMLASYKFKEIEDLKNSVLYVDDMFNLVNDYIGDMSLKDTFKWELGGINGLTGSNVTIDYAIRCDYFNLPCDIEATTTKDMYCISYNFDGSFHSRINKTGNTITLTDTDKKYRFVVNMGSGNTITDINTVLQYVIIKSRNQFEAKVKEIVNSATSTNVLKGKKINCLGDSITSTDYTTPNWWQQIATKTGANFNNYGISGTCIGYNEQRENNNGKCFCNRFDNMDTSADGVIVMGGTNDYEIKLGTWNDSTNETFYGALNVLIKGLLEKFKGKPIIFMTPIQSANDYMTNVVNPVDTVKNGSNSAVSLQLRAEAIKLKCKQYGITCIDLYNTSGINGVDSSKIYYRSGDSIHPSEYGQKVIANNLLPILESKFNF